MLGWFVLSVKSWLLYVLVDWFVVILLWGVVDGVDKVLLVEVSVSYFVYVCDVWDVYFFDVLFVW